MRVTQDMIDPELRTAGRIAKLLMRPTERFFRFMHRIDARMTGGDLAGMICEERRIPSLDEGVDVRVRVYGPASRAEGERLPGVLFLHGGGYAFGRPELTAALYKKLMDSRPCVVVAPDYRKSVDAAYPAALNDCYATLLWLKENGAELGVRDDQLIVMGQSAGGGLTAAVTLMARDRGDVRVAFQLPLYPMIDDRVTDSCRDNDAPVWNAKHNRVAWDLYLGGLSGEAVPAYAAPARATDYTGLPPTATFVGACDPFRDETTQYVEHLRAAGVPVAFELYEGAYHGFDGIVAGSKVARAANAFVQAQFAEAVDKHFAAQTAS